MKIILAKLKDFKFSNYHYLIKIYGKNYEVYSHPLCFRIYTNNILIDNDWINIL